MQDWYNDPITKVLWRLLWLEVDDIYNSESAIDKRFIQYAARNCARLLEIN